jgi:hypothetical protein
MQSDFIRWLRLNEAVKEQVFEILIDNQEYTVDRRGHLLQKRTGDNKPKDFNMSKDKYKRAIEQALKSTLNLRKSFSLIWVSPNGKNNILSMILKNNNTFSVFGAIMNSSDPEESLYKSATQRLKINL